jgi:hypothetical protein
MLRRNFLGLTPAIFSAGFLGFQPQESPSQYTIIKLEFDKIGQEIFTVCDPSLRFRYWRNHVHVNQVIDGHFSFLQAVPLASKQDTNRFIEEVLKRHPRSTIKFFEIKTPQGENVWAQIS